MFSRVLEKLAKRDPRIDEYEYDPDNGCGRHWLHLNHPYVCSGGDASIHEDYVRDMLIEVTGIVCQKCDQSFCDCKED